LLLSHLALALAGVCLTCAELDFLPELAIALPVYLGLVCLSWWLGRCWTLPMWAANVLGVLIAGGAALWVWYGLSDEGTWTQEVPLPGVIIPYLGPVLMALLLVRLFRSSPGDFWALQALGLLQVALGCVLAGDTLFSLLLLPYLVVALCALAAHERISLTWRNQNSLSPVTSHQSPVTTSGWVTFGARWAVAVAALTFPVFLLLPRIDGPEWEPMTRFAGRQPERKKQTGFSDEIDLAHGGAIEVDETVAFRVVVSDADGRVNRDLLGNQRWRGLVMDRYEEREAIWRTWLSWPGRGPLFRPQSGPVQPGSGELLLEFDVPRRTGCLFLADPVHLGPKVGDLPIHADPESFTSDPAGFRRPGLPFFEAGDTVMPLPYLSRAEYHYTQIFRASAERDRYQVVRLEENYCRKLLRCDVDGLGTWTIRLLGRLAETSSELPGLREALAGPRPAGWALPPRLWEPVARRLADHLSSSGEYSYSLTQRRESVDLDPVLDFLVNVKEGACERYAAALTLMLRSVGIPARIVKGYRGAEYRGGGSYEVRQSHAHAWVEAVVPALGKEGQALEWIALDPTPQTESHGGLASWLQQQQGRAGDVWHDLVLAYGSRRQAELLAALSGDWLSGALVVLVAALAGLFLLVWLKHGRAGARHRTGDRCQGLYERLLDLLAGPGLALRPRPGQTPRELADEARSLLLLRDSAMADLAEVPRRVVGLLYRARWGGQRPGEAELAAVEEQVGSLAKQLSLSGR
jgi:hypothetical protein